MLTEAKKVRNYSKLFFCVEDGLNFFQADFGVNEIAKIQILVRLISI